jgi:uridine phosphorylase
MTDNAPILEFDPDRSAILNPVACKLSRPCPPRAVLCFFQDVLDAELADGKLEVIGSLKSEIGKNHIYHSTLPGEDLLVFHPGVGAPLAAGFLDEIISLGVQKVIACGGCGVLLAEIAAGHAVILTSAVRDEGTSYHYLPPSREVSASPLATAALEQVLREREVPYRLGKSWTTDAYFRETPGRRALRLQDGCSVVEMEASAFFAVAQFRGIEFGQVVYGGDLVVPEGWDYRGWNQRHAERELLFALAKEACLRL